VTLHTQSWEQDTEAQFMEGLRARFEDEGFTFTTHPETAQLPDFLGSYVPDALAQKPGHNVAIEVKRRVRPSTARAMKDIRRRFEGHADWHFHAVFMGSDPLQSVTIPTSTPATIRSRVSEVRALTTHGHHRPAFIMAWSLLEATLRTLSGATVVRPATPGTVVQALAMNGYIEPEMERNMRALVDLRNRIVHGDLAAEPATADVELVLSAIEETLGADMSQADPAE
jgi:uncharacterized protein YutE (UPF0331/DUF86 family)